MGRQNQAWTRYLPSLIFVSMEKLHTNNQTKHIPMYLLSIDNNVHQHYGKLYRIKLNYVSMYLAVFYMSKFQQLWPCLWAQVVR